MFCKKCGNQLTDGAVFCNACGAKVEAEAPAQPTYQQPTYQQPVYQQPAYQQSANTHPEADSLANNSLIFGILALAIGGILGIIFGRMAQSKAADYMMITGALTGKANIGNILGKVGVILGIVSTIIIGLYVFIYVIMIGGIMASY